MNVKTVSVMICCFLFVMASTKTDEKPQWKGKIEYEDGVKVDIFSPEGYYLYRSSLPPNTIIIKNGFLYTRELDEDEGMEYVKRYKIKNWEQIKEGIE